MAEGKYVLAQELQGNTSFCPHLFPGLCIPLSQVWS